MILNVKTAQQRPQLVNCWRKSANAVRGPCLESTASAEAEREARQSSPAKMLKQRGLPLSNSPTTMARTGRLQQRGLSPSAACKERALPGLAAS